MGVELDSITGRLAKQLYPQANITVDGFERVNLPDNSIGWLWETYPWQLQAGRSPVR